MSTYESLTTYLLKRTDGELTLTFKEIESLIGSDLPKSAKIYNAYWANTQRAGHPPNKAARAAGYKAFLQPADEVVRFVRE